MGVGVITQPVPTSTYTPPERGYAPAPGHAGIRAAATVPAAGPPRMLGGERGEGAALGRCRRLLPIPRRPPQGAWARVVYIQ
eukprot:gene12822-biopygen1947